MKNFIIRACSAVVYAVLVIGCTLVVPQGALILFPLVAAAAIWEFGTIVNKHAGGDVPRMITSVAGLTGVAATWLYQISGQGYERLFVLYMLLMVYLLVSELYRKGKTPLLNWSYAFASQMYVAVPFALLSFLFAREEVADGLIRLSGFYAFAIFVFLWCNDTGAYLVGCTLSRYFPAKLFPSISPKKSWVGSIGGALLTMAASAALYYIMPDSMPLWRWMGFALVVVVFGTWGDLVESQLKRQLGIKDSGNFMPGHGGLLDRFDSALLAIPAVVAYLFLT